MLTSSCSTLFFNSIIDYPTCNLNVTRAHCFLLFIKSILGGQLVGFYAQNAEVTAINAPHKAVKAMLGYAGNVLLDHLFRVSDTHTHTIILVC